MALISCRGCQKTVSDQAANCPHCAIASPGLAEIVCNECKNKVNASSQTCPHCGIALNSPRQTEEKASNKSIELGLCIAAIVVGIWMWSIGMMFSPLIVLAGIGGFIKVLSTVKNK